MARPVRGLLFDKDGTLFDFQKSWAPINLKAAALASQGDEALRSRLHVVGGIDPLTGHAVADGLMASASAREIAEAFIAAGSAYSPDALTEALDALFMTAAGTMIPATDLPALFARLKARGLRLGIASSDSEAAVIEAARHFGLAPYLDFACGYDSGHGLKPSAGMPLAFCRATGLAPEETAVIGDNAHDMEMGRRAGVALRIGVLTGTGTRQSLAPHASAVIPGIDCLEEFLGFSPG